MDYLGSENLFFSKYIIGCEIPSNKNLDCINTLHNWLYFKDNDYGMKRYRTDRTQYIAFLNIIDLPVLKEIINDLIIIYKKEYPFGQKADFIEQVFRYTLYGLETFAEYDNYTFYGTPPNIKNEVYYKFERSDNEYIEFVTEPTKDIEYYQQYYKKVIQLINDFDFENPQIKSKPRQQKKNLQNMRDELFKINKKNYLDLEKEYSFSENESFFIHRNFWPIIVVNSYDTEWVKNQLEYYKTEFIKENKIFDLDIFKRNELDFLIFELNEYLDNIKKGKTKIWTECKGDYFHWFKLQLDTKSYTLLISDKNEIQLEIYFKTIVAEVSKFIENERVLPIQQAEIQPEQETETLSILITHTKSVEIVKSVKVQYKNIKGKRLKILLLAFQDLNLLPKERIAQKFYNCCKKEFEWDIASYTAMNGYNFNQNTDNDEFKSMKQNIETLIKTN